MTLSDGRHFVATDFACHDGTPYPEEWADRWAILLALCDTVRDIWGAPLSVVCGYRTPIYNAQLIASAAARGSHQVASGSRHIEGRAADLRPAMVTPERIGRLHDLVLGAADKGELPTLGGLGIYQTSGWIHVDTFKATDGHLRRWLGR